MYGIECMAKCPFLKCEQKLTLKISFRIRSKIEQVPPWPVLQPSKKFHEHQVIIFNLILLKNRQTNQTQSTGSLAKVINQTGVEQNPIC